MRTAYEKDVIAWADENWFKGVLADAVTRAIGETGLDRFPGIVHGLLSRSYVSLQP